MIKTKADYLYYLEADRIAKSKPLNTGLLTFIKHFIFPDRIWQFQKALRKYEFYKNCREGFQWVPLKLLAYRRYRNLSLKLGYTIPANVFGPGLSIAHVGSIVINGGAKIGANCRIHVGVNIGTQAGYSNRAPTLGDNCYIGPGVKIFGMINIPNCTVIGANAVVTRSFEDEHRVVLGVPAKSIKEANVFEVLIPATIIIEKELHKKYDLQGLPAQALNKKFNFR